MFSRSTPALLCLVLLSGTAKAEDQIVDRELIRKIVANLNDAVNDGKMERRDLEITVRKGKVTVTGRLESTLESRLVLNSIVSVPHVNGLQLNLGIGQSPSLICPCAAGSTSDPDVWKRPPNWGDGDWDFDFETQPLRHRTKR